MFLNSIEISSACVIVTIAAALVRVIRFRQQPESIYVPPSRPETLAITIVLSVTLLITALAVNNVIPLNTAKNIADACAVISTLGIAIRFLTRYC